LVTPAKPESGTEIDGALYHVSDLALNPHPD